MKKISSVWQWFRFYCLPVTEYDLHKLKIFIMATQAELAAQIKDVSTQLTKIGSETSATLAKVDELQAIIDQQGGVSPELQAAVDDLKAQVQKVDDLVPDAPAA